MTKTSTTNSATTMPVLKRLAKVIDMPLEEVTKRFGTQFMQS